MRRWESKRAPDQTGGLLTGRPPERPSRSSQARKFTGKIGKVTIELKEEKRADTDSAEQARRAAALTRALAD
jgi:hypothetical protein